MIKSNFKKILFINLVLFAMFLIGLIGCVRGAESSANATLKSRAALISGPNVGQTIYFTVGAGGTINQYAVKDHIYCVKHEDDTREGIMVVDAYVKIDGQYSQGVTLKGWKNKKNGKEEYRGGGTIVTNEKQSNKNVALAYILEKEIYRKGYHWKGISNAGTSVKDSGEIRRAAIHRYFKTDWLSGVGEDIIGSVVGDWKSNFSSWMNTKGKQNDYTKDHEYAQKLIDNAENYAKSKETTNGDMHCRPTITTEKKTMPADSVKTAGPFKVEYQGRIKGITVTDVDGKTIKASYIKITTDKAGKNVVEATKIQSGTNYYIQNTSNKIMKKINIELKKNEVLTAQIWFLMRYDGTPAQRVIKVESGIDNVGASININIEQPITITFTKVDADTNTALSNVEFKLKHEGYYATATGSKGNYVITDIKSDTAKATALVTNANGQLTIKLYEDSNKYYALNETKSKSGYTTNINSIKSSSTNIEFNEEKGTKGIDGSAVYFWLNRINSKNTATMTLTNKKPTTITIKKVDADNPKVTLAEVGFKLKHKKCYAKAKKVSDGTYRISGWGAEENIDQGTEMFTSSKGVLEITLDEESNKYYALYETTNTYNGYTGDISDVLEASNNIKVQTNSGGKGVIENRVYFYLNSENVKSKASLTIANKKQDSTSTSTTITFTKVDSNDNTVLSGVKFKLLHKKRYAKAVGSDGVYTVYDWGDESKVAQGTELETNSEGKLTITIPDDEENHYYAIREVQAKPGYASSVDKVTSKSENVAIRTKSGGNGIVGNSVYFYLNEENYSNTAEVTITNSPITEKIGITGYVWVDEQDTKGNNYDSLYKIGTRDKKIAGVKVNLKTKANKVIDTATTNSNGEYTFDKAINSNELSNHYVEFDYSETSYKQYIPVHPNLDIENGSKVAVDSVETAGVATTYNGNVATSEQVYGLSGSLYEWYDSNTGTLRNINLGLRFQAHEDYDIIQRLSYVDITMGERGHFKYNYGEPSNIDPNTVYAPRVSWQSGENISAYTRAFYPSDIVYDKINNTNELSAIVEYKISITNNNNQNRSDYQDLYMKISELTDVFDKDRYELADKNWSLKAGTNDIAVLNPESDLGKSIINKNINPNGTVTANICFKIKHKALEDMLKYPNGVIEACPVTARAHEIIHYREPEPRWINEELINVPVEKDRYGTPTADAPYLIIIPEGERTISGTVFEDSVYDDSNGQKLGDGKYDIENEETVKNVKVELLEVQPGKNVEDLPVANLYSIKTESGTISDEKVSAVFTTDEDGEYKLEGIVPGNYYIRYRYGNGKYEIRNLKGEVVDGGDNLGTTLKNGEDIKAKKYKSTIITSPNTKAAFENEKTDTEHNWFKNLEGNNYSVARDILSTRITVNENQDSENNILATTPIISVPMANKFTKNNEGDNKYQGLNFGIIKQPEQKVNVEKIITNIKLTNAQNNVMFNGNPSTAELKGVGDMSSPKNAEGSTYVRVEISEKAIYGSTLNLTYTLKVTNTSDLNYYNKSYYYYGDKNANQEVTLKVNTLNDYLEETLKFLPEASDKDKTITQDTKPIIMTDEEGEELTDYKGNSIKGYLLKITGLETLYTNKNKDRPNTKKVNTSDTVTIVAERILSNEDTDMEIINQAEIKIKGADSPEDPSEEESENPDEDPAVEVSTDKDDSDSEEIKKQSIRVIPQEIKASEKVTAKVTVIPPTGMNKQDIILYTITGIIASITLLTGIIIIKRKVL